MKAKVIETGEIVDVVSITDREYGCLISYGDSDGSSGEGSSGEGSWGNHYVGAVGERETDFKTIRKEK